MNEAELWPRQGRLGCPPRQALFGHCEAKNGIEPFGGLVDELMSVEPCASHPPSYPCFLAQGHIEIYFSIEQRKVLTPNDLADLDELAEGLVAIGEHYEQVGEPFSWKFTRHDLGRLLSRLAEGQPLPSSSAA